MKFVDFVINELLHRRYSKYESYCDSIFSADFSLSTANSWYLRLSPYKWYHFLLGGKGLILQRGSGSRAQNIILTKDERKRLTVAYKAAIKANKEIARQRKEAAQYL